MFDSGASYAVAFATNSARSLDKYRAIKKAHSLFDVKRNGAVVFKAASK